MIPFDQKKAVTMVLGPDKKTPEVEGDESPETLDSIAHALIEAVHGKSVEGVRDALHAFIEEIGLDLEGE